MYFSLLFYCFALFFCFFWSRIKKKSEKKLRLLHVVSGCTAARTRRLHVRALKPNICYMYEFLQTMSCVVCLRCCLLFFYAQCKTKRPSKTCMKMKLNREYGGMCISVYIHVQCIKSIVLCTLLFFLLVTHL